MLITRSRRAIAVLGSIAILALACERSTAPGVSGSTFPTGAVAFTAPARYALWWSMTEACSGLSANRSAVQWYVMPGQSIFTVDGKIYEAIWFNAPDRIVLGENARADAALVRHEMLHVLLQRAGHPREAFLGACGDIVQCVGECETEAGGRTSPPADAPVLTPQEVGVRLDLWPPSPAASIDSGAAALVVSITNPRSQAAWVQLTPRQSGSPLSDTFGVNVTFTGSGADLLLTSATEFGTRFPLGANETRRWVWDGQLLPGRFDVRGWFNSDTTSRRTIDVGP